MALALISYILHVPGHLVDDLPEDQLRKLWSRTQWILKSNFLPNVKWEGVIIPPSTEDQEDEQTDD